MKVAQNEAASFMQAAIKNPNGVSQLKGNLYIQNTYKNKIHQIEQKK